MAQEREKKPHRGFVSRIRSDFRRRIYNVLEAAASCHRPNDDIYRGLEKYRLDPTESLEVSLDWYYASTALMKISEHPEVLGEEVMSRTLSSFDDRCEDALYGHNVVYRVLGLCIVAESLANNKELRLLHVDGKHDKTNHALS